MIKAIKRFLSFCLVLVTIASMTAPAHAASTTAFDILSTSKYANVRTISTGNTIVYTDKSLKHRGTETFGRSNTAYVDGSDDLRIMDVGCSNNQWWAYIQYKTSSGKNVRGYIYLSAITTNNGSHKKTVSTGKFYCALRENESTHSKFYVAKGDTIYLVAVSSSGEKYQIMYPAGGVYRIAWVSKSDYLKYNGEPQPVANGTYTIVSALNGNKVVDICNASTKNGGNVQLYQSNGTNAQQFQLIYNSAGYYTIKNVGSGLVLDVAGGRVASGVNVQQYQSNNTKAQRWYLESAGNGYYYIRSALGYYLDVTNASTSNGTNIRVWTGNKTNAQKFKFVAVASSTNSTYAHPMKNFHKDYTQWGVKPSYRNGSSRQYHVGVDYMSNSDRSIYAFADGTVVSSGWQDANGNFVLIEHSIPDANGNRKTVYSFYAHLSKRSVSAGQTVSAGTIIGEVGKTGSSGGSVDHLHFAIIDYKWASGGVYGYVTKFSGNKVKYDEVTYYNPYYVIEHGRLP